MGDGGGGRVPPPRLPSQPLFSVGNGIRKRRGKGGKRTSLSCGGGGGDIPDAGKEGKGVFHLRSKAGTQGPEGPERGRAPAAEAWDKDALGGRNPSRRAARRRGREFGGKKRALGARKRQKRAKKQPQKATEAAGSGLGTGISPLPSGFRGGKEGFETQVSPFLCRSGGERRDRTPSLTISGHFRRGKGGVEPKFPHF